MPLVKLEILHNENKDNKHRLFLRALSSTQEGYVLYISQSELTEIPPVPSLKRHYLKMMTFLYLNNFDSLIEGLSTLPSWQNVPATIVLDELNAYCSSRSNQVACGVISLLMDAARSCSQILKTPCNVLVSIDKNCQSDECYKLLVELYGQYKENQV